MCVCVCVCACVCACVHACVRVCVLRIVSRDKILCCINALLLLTAKQCGLTAQHRPPGKPMQHYAPLMKTFHCNTMPPLWRPSTATLCPPYEDFPLQHYAPLWRLSTATLCPPYEDFPLQHYAPLMKTFHCNTMPPLWRLSTATLCPPFHCNTMPHLWRLSTATLCPPYEDFPLLSTATLCPTYEDFPLQHYAPLMKTFHCNTMPHLWRLSTATLCPTLMKTFHCNTMPHLWRLSTATLCPTYEDFPLQHYAPLMKTFYCLFPPVFSPSARNDPPLPLWQKPSLDSFKPLLFPKQQTYCIFCSMLLSATVCYLFNLAVNQVVYSQHSHVCRCLCVCIHSEYSLQPNFLCFINILIKELAI